MRDENPATPFSTYLCHDGAKGTRAVRVTCRKIARGHLECTLIENLVPNLSRAIKARLAERIQATCENSMTHRLDLNTATRKARDP